MALTDDQRELFQVVDEDDRPLGARTRAECHADPALIHRSVYVVVETGAGMLYQRRGLGKDSHPGFWDLACAGHVAAGETYEAAAGRELAEEVGLEGGELEPLGRFLYRDARETEMTAIFRVRSDGPFTLRPPEVIGLVALPEPPAPLTPHAKQVLSFVAGRHPPAEGSPNG
jgi:isopentenyldiphosphate isomerase